MRTIDIHTHGIEGYDTRSGDVGALLAVAKAHGASGVSAIVLSVYPAPIAAMRRQIGLIREAMGRQVQGARQKVQGGAAGSARILGVHLEGPFLNPSRAGALDAGSFVEPSAAAFDELLNGFRDIVKVMTVAPELPGALPVIEKAAGEGIVVAMGHSDANYAEAEEGFRAGARSVTHLFNAMRTFHHREPGLAGFGLLRPEVYVELIADPLHLDEKTLALVFKVKDPERIVIVSDSVRETGAAGGGPTRDNSGRLIGGSMTVTRAAARLAGLGFPERVVKEAITTNPARLLGL